MLRDFIVWHFRDMPRRLFEMWRGLLRFTLHYFALGYHLRTFFRPWHRQRLSRGRGLDLKELGNALTFNAVGIVIGMLLRTFVIIMASAAYIGAAVVGGVLLLVWFVLPLAALYLVGWGISNII